MRRPNLALLLVCVWFATAAIGCGPPPPAPYAGERSLAVPYFQQPPGSMLCGPTCIKMWQQYQFYSSSSIQTIYDWMVATYPGEVSPNGASPAAIAGGTSHFVQIAMTLETYADFPGSNTEKRRALADLAKNVYNGDPVVAICEYGLHTVVVNGVTWQVLEEAVPQGDWVITRDPKRSERTVWTVGTWLNDVGQACVSGDCLQQIMIAYRRYWAQAELDEFEYHGGVYLGPPPPGATGRWKLAGTGTCVWDPNDSGPDQCSPAATGRWKLAGDGSCYWDPDDSGPDQCAPGEPTGRWKLAGDGSCYWDPNDSGPDQCAPQLAGSDLGAGPSRVLGWFARLWTAVVDLRGGSLTHYKTRTRVMSGRTVRPLLLAGAAIAARQDRTTTPGRRAARLNTSVPRPFGTSRADIIINFYTAVRQSRLDRMPGLERLTAQSTDWRVRDVIPVSSVGHNSDYYLLHLTDGTGSVVGAAVVDDEGYLLGYEDSQDSNLPRPVSLDFAESLVRVRLGHANVRVRRYVYASNTLEPGSSRFAPLVLIQRADGDYYINTAGQVFREASRSADVNRSPGEKRMLLRRSTASEFVEVR